MSRTSLIYNFTDEVDNLLDKAGVYSIKSSISNIYYIGSTTKSFRDRWILHFFHLNKNNHYNNKLQNHINKYGIGDIKFSIVEIIDDKNLCRDREKYWIDFYDSYKNGFNLTLDTDNSISGDKHHLYKDIDKDIVKDLYTNDKYSTRKIAGVLNVSQNKIRSVLKELNIDMNNGLNILPIKEIYYRNLLGKEKLSDLAREFNVPDSTIRRQFKRFGFKSKMDILKDDLPLIIEYFNNGGSIVDYCKKTVYSHDSVYRRLPK